MLTVNCTGNDVKTKATHSIIDNMNETSKTRHSSGSIATDSRQEMHSNDWSHLSSSNEDHEEAGRGSQFHESLDSTEFFLIIDKNNNKMLHDDYTDINDRNDKKIVNLSRNDKNVNKNIKKEILNQRMNNGNLMRNNKNLEMKLHDSIAMNKIGINQCSMKSIGAGNLSSCDNELYLNSREQVMDYGMMINNNQGNQYRKSLETTIQRNIQEDDDSTGTNTQQIVKGPWSKEEDLKLVELISRFGPKNWSKIADLMKTRIGKQCRERWHNHLHPNIKKTPFTPEEDILVIKLHNKYGNRWSEIAKFLPGRTDNAIKNHWNSALQKRMKKRSFSVETPVCLRNDRCCCSQCTKRKMYRRRSEGVCEPMFNRRILPVHDERCKCRDCVADKKFIQRIISYEKDEVRRKFEKMTERERIASIALLRLSSCCK